MNAEPRHDLERIGMRVAAEQDRRLYVQALPDADVLLAGVGARQRKAQVRARVLGTAATALVLLLGVIGVLQLRKPSAAVAGAAPAVQPDLGVTRAASLEVPLRFVDGTRVIVKPQAVADLRSVTPHGATIALERGTIDVDVVHTDASRWDVIAGQFDIRVTGTRFDATWDPQTKQLTVAMMQGTVRVSGPCVDEPLSAPTKKVFMCGDAPTIAATALPAAPASASPSGKPTSASASGKPTAAAKATSATSATSASPGTGEASARDMLGLADASRLSGDTAGARKTYTRVREQFPRTDEAAKAAFLLGRMSEASGAADDAVRSYASAMSESPNGAFAQDALGRTMELEQRRGRSERARALANDYLSKYPNGPYRAYAASVLDARP